MKYVIFQKAKPYTRTRRGRAERVRGYASRYPLGVDPSHSHPTIRKDIRDLAEDEQWDIYDKWGDLPADKVIVQKHKDGYPAITVDIPSKSIHVITDSISLGRWMDARAGKKKIEPFDEPPKPGRKIQVGAQWAKGDRTDTEMADTLRRQRKQWMEGKKQKRKESRGGASFQHYEEVRT